MKNAEYMHIKYKYFPADIRQRYGLESLLANDDYIYICIKKEGIYGLKQAAILAYKHLVNQLAPHGYRPCQYTTGLWTHET
jgi:L-arabinose isomerase